MIEENGVGLPRRTTAELVEEFNAADYPNVRSVVRIAGCSIGVRLDAAPPIRIYTRPGPSGEARVVAVQVDFENWILTPREMAHMFIGSE